MDSTESGRTKKISLREASGRIRGSGRFFSSQNKEFLSYFLSRRPLVGPEMKPWLLFNKSRQESKWTTPTLWPWSTTPFKRSNFFAPPLISSNASTSSLETTCRDYWELIRRIKENLIRWACRVVVKTLPKPSAICIKMGSSTVTWIPTISDAIVTPPKTNCSINWGCLMPLWRRSNQKTSSVRKGSSCRPNCTPNCLGKQSKNTISFETTSIVWEWLSWLSGCVDIRRVSTCPMANSIEGSWCHTFRNWNLKKAISC